MAEVTQVRVRVVEMDDGLYFHLDTILDVLRAAGSGPRREEFVNGVELELRRGADVALAPPNQSRSVRRG